MTAKLCVLASVTGGAAFAIGGASGLTQPSGVPENESKRTALERLFRQVPPLADWFAPAFLAQVSAGRVAEIVAGLQGRHGPFREIVETNGSLSVRLLRADIPVQVVLDAQGRIAGLLFQTAEPAFGTLDDAVRAVADLPGRTAALVVTDGRTRAAHGADVPLAVGSAFKLAVLRAAAEAHEAGRLAWDQVVRLDPAWRSLPSGILQDWPDGTPVTVATLANLMVSLSDNTATDALLCLVGRSAVEALSPHNAPFLTTREAWVLKAAANGALRQEWLAADTASRRQLLPSLAALPLPRPADLAPGVTSDVEWFFTAEELCALLESTRSLPALGISKGPVDPGRWRSVAYKGGSEAGVLNLSATVEAESGKRHCVVATWNGTGALDQERLLEPFGAILRLLGHEG